MFITWSNLQYRSKLPHDWIRCWYNAIWTGFWFWRWQRKYFPSTRIYRQCKLILHTKTFQIIFYVRFINKSHVNGNIVFVLKVSYFETWFLSIQAASGMSSRDHDRSKSPDSLGGPDSGYNSVDSVCRDQDGTLCPSTSLSRAENDEDEEEEVCGHKDMILAGRNLVCISNPTGDVSSVKLLDLRSV